MTFLAEFACLVCEETWGTLAQPCGIQERGRQITGLVAILREGTCAMCATEVTFVACTIVGVKWALREALTGRALRWILDGRAQRAASLALST
jgi:hypothetical protein